jgi:transposase
VCDGRGVPLAVEVSAGQRNECEFAEQVLDAVRIPGRVGRPRRRPGALAGDKGYSFRALRAWLRRHRVRAVIPERADQMAHRAHRPGRKPAFDRAAYRRRNVVERLVAWLKERRRLATRYEKLARHYLAVVKLAMVERCLRLTLPDTP